MIMAVSAFRTGFGNRVRDLAVYQVVNRAGEQVRQFPKGLEFRVLQPALLKGVEDRGRQSGLDSGIGDRPVQPLPEEP